MSSYKPGTYISLFIGAHFAHHLLTALVVPILPYIRDSFDLSYGQSGIVVSAFTLSYGIGQLPAGWLADKVGRTYLITIGISGVALAGAIAGLTTTYPALIAALILMGITGGGYHPSAAPLITASVPPDRQGRALGLHLIGGSASHFVTPLLGAALAGVFGFRGAFLGIAGPVLIFGFLFFAIIRARGEQRWEATQTEPAPDTGQREDAPATSGKEAPKRGESRRRTMSRVAVFLVMTSSVGAAIASITAFMPLYLVDTFGLSEELAAAGLSLFFVTGIVAAPVGGVLSDRFGPVPVLIGLSIVSGPLLVIAAFAPTAILFVTTIVVVGVAQFVRMPVSESYLSADVPEKLRSTVLGVYFFAGMEASGVLTPILGYLIDVQGFTRAFSLFGLVLMGMIVITSLILRSMHRTHMRLDAAAAGQL